MEDKLSRKSFKVDPSTSLSRRVRFEYSADPKVEKGLDPKLLLKILRQEIAKLPEGQRISLHLYHQENMSVQDLSGILSSNEKDIRLHLTRGFENLHKSMKKYGVLLSKTALLKSIRSIPKEVAPPRLIRKVMAILNSSF